MRKVIAALLLGTCLTPSAPAQDARRAGPVASAAFRTTYIQLPQREAEGLLFEPTSTGPKRRIALVFAHPSGNSFTEPLGPEMASRGYTVLIVDHHAGPDEADDAYLPSISSGIAYLRTLPGIERVVIVGHSGGGHLTALYQNVAEHGPDACSGPEKIYPCRRAMATGLQRTDGIALLDPTLGAFHQMSSLDPAASTKARDAAVDMFAPANGYDPTSKRARYALAFRQRFLGAQAARNAALVAQALDRLKAVESGAARFDDDEPFVVPGIGVTSSGARLYQPDTSTLSHTKGAYPLVRADGVSEPQVIRSVRSPTGQQAPAQLRSLEAMGKNTTVRRFLASTGFRTLPGYDLTEDDITGADWKSAFSATPANAEGITVPALVLTMSCHYLVVPGEIIFRNLASRDKSYASVEGATHVFTPCRPEYGDTVKATFDYLDGWLSKPGRF